MSSEKGVFFYKETKKYNNFVISLHFFSQLDIKLG